MPRPQKRVRGHMRKVKGRGAKVRIRGHLRIKRTNIGKR